MENSYYNSRQIRKPNKKIWICPFCRRDTNTMNSRGAPAHLRNKHRLNWKKEYLEKPELLFKNRYLNEDQERYCQFRELFSDIDIGDNTLKIRIFIQIYYLIKSTRKALKENDYSRLHEINRMMPTIGIKPKNK